MLKEEGKIEILKYFNMEIYAAIIEFVLLLLF
jgi:hypothetical protein